MIAADDFHALARSSPWLWRSIELVWDGGSRVWMQRPSRVVVDDGRNIVRRNDDPGRGISVIRLGGDPASPTPEPDFRFVSEFEPVRRADGLVLARDFGIEAVAVHQPMVCGYFSVAALDPVELADGVELSELRVVEHAGRTSWVARCRARSGYEPRCSCCALLPNDALAVLEWGEERAATMTWPDSVEIWLDRQTGVMTRWLPDGGGHAPIEIEIVEVDGNFESVWRRAREE